MPSGCRRKSRRTVLAIGRILSSWLPMKTRRVRVILTTPGEGARYRPLEARRNPIKSFSSVSSAAP